MNVKIIPISSKDTHTIRQFVLRRGKSIEECYFDGDNLNTTNHFGLFIDENLKGCVSVYENKNSSFTIENQIQVRGMAVLEEFQKKGFGKMLMNVVQDYAISNKKPIIWFNAREIAVPFYENLGYTKIGIPFEITRIGTHYLLFKKHNLTT